MRVNKMFKMKRFGILEMFRLSMLIIGLFLTGSVSAQLPTATEIAGKMKMGWNLGNTFEAICGETAWGGPVTTQQLIDSVKAAGFTSVRIP